MIRLLTREDIPEFVSMSKVFYSMPCCDHNISDSHFYRTAEYCLAGNTDYAVLIIEDDGKILGYCSIAISYSTEAGGKNVLIDEIYIKETYQSQGLGHQVFEYIFKNYPAARYRLECTESNQGAMRLYRNMGFQPLEYLQLVLDKEY